MHLLNRGSEIPPQNADDFQIEPVISLNVLHLMQLVQLIFDLSFLQ